MTQHQVSRLVTEPADAKPGSPSVLHLVGGILVAFVGFVLMLTGGLAAVGIVVLTIGVLYAAIAWIVSLLPSRPAGDRIP